MNYLIFFMGFMTGKIVQDIINLIELKEVEEDDKLFERLSSKAKTNHRNRK